MQGLADGYFVLPVHDRQLPRAAAQQADPGHRPPGVQGGRARPPRERYQRLPRHQGHPLARLVPPRARQDHLGLLRHGAHARGPGEGARPSCPRCTRSSSRTCACTGDGATQPDAGEGRTGRRLLPAGMLMCRDALERRGELRRPLPRRVPVRRRRGQARRRALRPRRRVGVDGRPDDADPQRRAARVRGRPPRSPELQVSDTTSTNITLKIWRQDGPDDAGRFETYRVDAVSDEASFLEMLDVAQRAADRRGQGADRVRPRLPRGHLRHVLADDRRPGARPAEEARRRASCTCASSPTATTITSSRGGPPRSRSSRT